MSVLRLRRYGAGAALIEPELQLVIDQMTLKPSESRKQCMNNLVKGLKDAGIWNHLDLFYLLHSHDRQAARLNWKDPSLYTLQEVGTVSFVANKHYASDGTTGYLRTGWNPATNGVNFTLNSHSLGSYHNGGVGNTPSVAMGVTGPSGNRTSIVPRNFGELRVQDNGTTVSRWVRGNLLTNFISMKRTSATNLRVWRRETDMTIVEQDFANSSIGIPNAELYLMAHNNNGTADSFSNSLYTYNCLFTGGGGC